MTNPKRLTKEEIKEIGNRDDHDPFLCSDDIQKLLSHIDAVEADLINKNQEIDRLRKGLEFYAKREYLNPEI